MRPKVFRKINELQAELQNLRSQNLSIGFVATMGALHRGHGLIIRRSKKENPVTVCSIFVNPTQFNNPEDLKNYPRTEEADLNLLQERKCDIVFIPTVEEIYPTSDLLDIGF